MTNFHSYSPADGHNLKHNPFKALIAPRPIGWISTVSKSGAVNLAPFSFFNAFSEYPPIIGFVSNKRQDTSLNKDTFLNIEETGEFVHNVVPTALAKSMNQSSALYARGVDEMKEVGLEAVASDVVAAPRLLAAPASMECKLIEIKRLAGVDGTEIDCWLLLGEVVRIHINKELLVDGMVDEEALGALGRLGYFNYAGVDNVFAMGRPKV